MPRRQRDLWNEILARYSYQHARAVERAVGNAERFEALTLAEQFVRGYMAADRGAELEPSCAHTREVCDLRSSLLAALAEVVGEEEIVAAFRDGTCRACGGELESGRAKFCLPCNEDQLDGVVFPWVRS